LFFFIEAVSLDPFNRMHIIVIDPELKTEADKTATNPLGISHNCGEDGE
jgi:hypothetical protein